MKYTKTLKHNHLFKRLYHKGNSQVTPFLAVYILKNQNKSAQEMNLLGITVGTKLGGAVQRNRVRRKIREIYRLHEEQLKPGYLIVIVARNRCVNASYSQLEKSFLLLCDQLELSKNPVHPPKFQKSGQKSGYQGVNRTHNKNGPKNKKAGEQQDKKPKKIIDTKQKEVGNT